MVVGGGKGCLRGVVGGCLRSLEVVEWLLEVVVGLLEVVGCWMVVGGY
jgi:hypothetical protein